MECLHCGISFHDSWSETTLSNSGYNNTVWIALNAMCPSCHNAIVKLQKREYFQTPGVSPRDIGTFIAFPRNRFRKPTPSEVPEAIKDDYEEACAVLSISEKASAALARRCLQAILREQDYPQRDLAKQIDAVLNETDPTKAIPTGLRTTIDAIRNFGNFSAHPVTDQTTLQIVDVEPEEAEWCLEILEEMFDHYYVKPAQAVLRKAALNQKLAATGKPPSR
jgi:hypothetical protein